MIKSISRKKKVILFVISFSIIAIFLYYYGFFSRYNYLTAKYDIQRGNVRIISVDSPADFYFPLESLRKKYNIKMEHCESVFLFNEIFHRGSDIYNNQMKKQIPILLGEKKYRKYLHELDSLRIEFAKPPAYLEIPKKK